MWLAMTKIKKIVFLQFDSCKADSDRNRGYEEMENDKGLHGSTCRHTAAEVDYGDIDVKCSIVWAEFFSFFVQKGKHTYWC